MYVCKLLYLLYIIVWVCVCGVSPELFTRSQDDATRGERSKKAIFVVASFILDNSQRHIQLLSLSLFLSFIHTHTLLQESASMFSKIEFLKIVLGKEAAGNMKAPVEPTTLPAAQRHAPLHFAKRAHIHTHTHHTHYVHLAVFFGCGTSSTSSFRHSTKSMQLSLLPFLLHTL